MPSPLDGIRVLDFTRFQQGPHGTVMLGDMGADVLKVEAPDGGDLGRSLGLQPDGFCAYFEAHNRNKRSITLDLQQPEAKEIVYKLVEQCDVTVENFRRGVMDRLGFSYEKFREINPRVIYAVASGYGPVGPIAERPSYDMIGQAMGGIMVAQGGGPDHTPELIVGGLADQVGSMMLAYGIMTALVARERFGVGQKVDVSLLGSQIALQGWGYSRYLRQRKQPNVPADANPLASHYQAADGKWLIICSIDPKQWPDVCAAFDLMDLAEHPLFATPRDRFKNQAELRARLQSQIQTRPRQEWLDRLLQNDIPHGPVYSYAEAAEDEQILANQYITTVEHHSLGTLGVAGCPVTLSETPGFPRSGSPELGQNTEEVLLDLGYDWDSIGIFRDKGVI
ncbi:MAG TPA: CoA transferase [Dehalococcoidia bacterium]|nr:CoA transferase [Dehalococcoidia bacterium]